MSADARAHRRRGPAATGSSSSAGSRPRRARSRTLERARGRCRSTRRARAAAGARARRGALPRRARTSSTSCSLGVRPVDEGWTEGVIGADGDRTMYDALADPELRRRARAADREDATSRATPASLDVPRARAARRAPTAGAPDGRRAVQLVDRLRRARWSSRSSAASRPGDNPELEMLRFLTDARLREHRARWRAGTSSRGELDRRDARRAAGASSPAGATAGSSCSTSSSRDADGLPRAACAELGEVTGAHAHRARLGRHRPRLRARGAERRGARRCSPATIDEEIERDLPSTCPTTTRRSRRSPAAARRCASACAARRTPAPAGASSATTATSTSARPCSPADGWVDPRLRGRAGAPAAERRRKRSPLRDVAGMLRSFAYAASAAELQRGAPGARGLGGARARGVPRRLPRARRPARCCRAGQAAIEQLLAIFELEKAVYELRYELNNRPDWVRIPVAGHRRACWRSPSHDADARAHRRPRPRRAARRPRRAPARTAASSCAPSGPAPSAVVVARRRRRASSSSAVAPRRRVRGRRSTGATLPLATSSRSTTPTATRFTVARPVPLPADDRRARPAPRRRGPPRGALRDARRARARDRRRRRAPRSRSGRRRRGRSAWSATSTPGTGGCTRCARWARRASGSCSCPASADGAALQVRDPHAGGRRCG